MRTGLGMNTNKSIFCVLTLFFVGSVMVYGQPIQFKILNGGEEIGHIVAKKETLNYKTTYDIVSKASFRVFFQYVRETSMKVVWHSGNFESSETKQLMNEELKEHRVTKQGNAGYDCFKILEEEKFSLTTPIKFCSSMLYFEEPKGYSHIFAESYQELCPLELIAPGIYKLTLPQGKVNHYVYKNGVLQEIRVFRTMVDLVFKRV